MPNPKKTARSRDDELFDRVKAKSAAEDARGQEAKARAEKRHRDRAAVIDHALRLPRALRSCAHDLDDGILYSWRVAADGETVITTSIAPPDWEEKFLRPWCRLWMKAARALRQEDISLDSISALSASADFGASVLHRCFESADEEPIFQLMRAATEKLGPGQGTYLRSEFWMDIARVALRQLLERQDVIESRNRTFSAMSERDRDGVRDVIAKRFNQSDRIGFFGYFREIVKDEDAIVLTVVELAENLWPRESAEALMPHVGLKVCDGRAVLMTEEDRRPDGVRIISDAKAEVVVGDVSTMVTGWAMVLILRVAASKPMRFQKTQDVKDAAATLRASDRMCRPGRKSVLVDEMWSTETLRTYTKRLRGQLGPHGSLLDAGKDGLMWKGPPIVVDPS